MDQVKTPEDYWKWSRTVLAPALRARPWYNGSQPYGLAGFVQDYSSRMIGYALMRQVRVTNQSCAIPKHFSTAFDFCLSDDVFLAEDTGKSSVNWASEDPSFTPSANMKHIYKAFEYRNKEDLNSYSYLGAYKMYPGGGFIHELR